MIETNGHGHRLWYISLLLRRLSELPGSRRVRLVTQAGVLVLPGWREHISPWEHLLTPTLAPPKRSQISILRGAVREGSVVVIPDADLWLPAVVLTRFLAFRSLTGSILLMRPKPELGWSSQLRHAGKALLLKGIRLLHPNLQVYRLVAVASASEDGEVLDPVEFSPSEHARDEWLRLSDLDPAVRWLAVLGEISERKCVRTVATALASETAEAAGWKLLIAGDTKDESLIKELMEISARRPGQIVFRRGFLGDEEFDTWINVTDAVSVLYRNEGSSGVLLKCWAAGTPVLVGGAAGVRGAARQLGMKRVEVAELSTEAVLDGLAQISEASCEAEEPQWRERTNSFANSLLRLNSTLPTKVGT